MRGRHRPRAARRRARGRWRIGTFDGVHAGHRAVIGRAVRLAAERGLTSAVAHLRPPPAGGRRPGACAAPAHATDEKVRLIAELGPDELVVLPFDEQLAALTPAEFCDELLAGALAGARRRRRRELQLRRRRRRRRGARCAPAAPRTASRPRSCALVTEHGEPISSTRIRRLLHDGRARGGARDPRPAAVGGRRRRARRPARPHPGRARPPTSTSRRARSSPAAACTRRARSWTAPGTARPSTSATTRPSRAATSRRRTSPSRRSSSTSAATSTTARSALDFLHKIRDERRFDDRRRARRADAGSTSPRPPRSRTPRSPTVGPRRPERRLSSTAARRPRFLRRLALCYPSATVFSVTGRQPATGFPDAPAREVNHHGNHQRRQRDHHRQARQARRRHRLPRGADRAPHGAHRRPSPSTSRPTRRTTTHGAACSRWSASAAACSTTCRRATSSATARSSRSSSSASSRLDARRAVTVVHVPDPRGREVPARNGAPGHERRRRKR